MSCLFVISSFWGYEKLSNYCHICSRRTWAENIKAATTTTKNGNTNYFGMNYKISIAPNYKKTSISYHLHMLKGILQNATVKRETINGAEAEEDRLWGREGQQECQ